MKNEKVSVLVTVLNEAETIEKLLDGLAQQTVNPDEIVIIDAGSSDETVSLIKQWALDHPGLKIIVKVKTGLNRSQGRNWAAKVASGHYMAITDAGCVPDKKWLECLLDQIVLPEVKTAAGYYKMRHANAKEEVFSWYLGILPEDFDEENFLPSSRSLMVEADQFQKVGGYPEDLDTCEDLVMAARLKQAGGMRTSFKATVDWMMPKSLSQFFHQVAGYVAGDVAAGYRPHLFKISTVWMRYGLFLWQPGLFLFYCLYPLFKWRRKLRTGLFYWAIIIQLTSDAAVLWGSLAGVLKKATYREAQ